GFARRLAIESDRLARLTREIIQLTRLQATDVLQAAERISVDRVVEQAIDRSRVEADSSGIALVRGKPVGAQVYGDEDLLVTAVRNLIANAIQYSPDHSRVGVGVIVADGVVEIA